MKSPTYWRSSTQTNTTRRHFVGVPVVILKPLIYSTHEALIECGHSNFVALRQAAQTLSRGNCGSLFSAQLQPLIDKSYEHMQRLVQQSAITAWRRLYTDSCILKSLLAFDAQTALESISILDRAIIIAGAVGYGRHNLVLSIINKIQSIFLPYDDSACRSISRSLTENFDDGALLLTATKAISSISPPTFLSFQSDHSRHPFILRCYAEDWPALCEHSWSSARYLRSISGRGRIVPVEVGKDYRRMDWTQILMSWDEFLSSLDLHDQPHTRSNEEIFYLAQHHLMMQFPPLRDDIVVPDYVYAEVSHSDYQAYKPPQNDDRLILNTWLGPRGTISPAHTVREKLIEITTSY